MSKRIEEMKASEAMESICNTIDFLVWLLDAGDAEEDECEDMMECAEAHGMVGLPRDADGEPIHIGDLMALGDDQAFYVEEMHLVSSDKDGCMWQVSNNAGSLVKSDMLHHVPEDTIEGILVENDKLRELLRDTLTTISWCTIDCCPSDSKKRELNARACELGIELNDCE